MLLIAVDDLRPFIACYGDRVAITPHIDRLASSGTLFMRAYVQQAVCNPSRASMLTGLRPDQIGVWNLSTHFRKNLPDVVTLPQYFKMHGYHTREIGKIFHDPEKAKDPVSWSAPSRLHITRNYPGHKYVQPENLEGIKGWKASACESADVQDSAYIDGKVANAAIEVLREIKDSTFFLAVGFRRPHLPFSAPQSYWGLYKRDEIPMPLNPLSPGGAPEYAGHSSQELRGYRDIPDTGVISLEKMIELRHGYYAGVSYVDAMTGKLINRLEELGLRDNTIIVFWSDHGYHLGEHDLWGKTTNYELDTRIPFIISVPGQVAKGSHVQAIVESVDIYPTLTELAGLPLPEALAGESLVPFIIDPKKTWNKPAISQFPRPWPYRDKPDLMGYSIRTDKYRYVQWNKFSTGEVQARELYNHEKDPLETKNIALDKNNGKLINELQQKLREIYMDGFVAGFPENKATD